MQWTTEKHCWHIWLYTEYDRVPRKNTFNTDVVLEMYPISFPVPVENLI